MPFLAIVVCFTTTTPPLTLPWPEDDQKLHKCDLQCEEFESIIYLLLFSVKVASTFSTIERSTFNALKSDTALCMITPLNEWENGVSSANFGMKSAYIRKKKIGAGRKSKLFEGSALYIFWVTVSCTYIFRVVSTPQNTTERMVFTYVVIAFDFHTFKSF